MCDDPKMGRKHSMCENPKKGQCVQGTEVNKGIVP